MYIYIYIYIQYVDVVRRGVDGIYIYIYIYIQYVDVVRESGRNPVNGDTQGKI